ncbi:Stf0 sulfotransferase family protein [Pseudooceanicola sp. CBS1P-1]|uniref:Sulfotransferase n=1 Tax=Pseudooceanicola albus TaxID=2692189 RepID=A0A6L7FYA2_9RHOB|nr:MULTISPECIES: hypothetical protein [Pseudooceanicola]MBT9383265.1 Stf0 sulfotransferase family protein [Pseudooceanicola endophyticus]MXN16412.1 hypothetical protein [Pseudooceanicola albus]
MTGSDLIFVIGRQRSGTTVFRTLLTRAGALNCDEIFHGDLSAPHRFYGFVRDRVQERPELVHPQHHPRLFRDYIAALRRQAGGRRLVMDVKYFGLNLIPQREDVDGRKPFVIGFMQESGAGIVHIRRRNKLRVHVSEQISIATGKWSAERAEQMITDKPRLHLDIAVALAAIDRLERQDARVQTLLATVPGVVRLDYEDMFTEAGDFTPEVCAIGERLLGGSAVEARPANLRMNPEPLEALVDNHGDLVAALVGTRHAWMLEAAG